MSIHPHGNVGWLYEQLMSSLPIHMKKTLNLECFLLLFSNSLNCSRCFHYVSKNQFTLHLYRFYKQYSIVVCTKDKSKKKNYMGHIVVLF